MKKIMAFGTFDGFHPGHEDFLRQAKKLGGHLTVVIARDKTVLEVKGKLPKNNEEKRMARVIESDLAEEVILGNEYDKYKVVEEYRPDFICLGYDQKFFIEGLKEKLKEFGLRGTKIVKLDPFHPEIYKSSKLKARNS